MPSRRVGGRARLTAMGSAPNVLRYAGGIWRSREFIKTLAANDFSTRHSGTILGSLWNVLSPLLMLATYWLVFGVVLAGRRPENFLAFLAVGIFLFRFVQRSAADGAGSLLRNKGLIRSVQFPRAVLPLSAVARNALSFLWELPVVLMIVVAVTRAAPTPGWVIFLVVLVPMAAVFASGLALLLARLATVVADIRQIIPLAFRILFYLSGILFPVRAFLEDHPLLEYLVLNPIYAFVTLARHYTLGAEPDAGVLWLSTILWTLSMALVGLVFFSRSEHRYGGA